MSRRRMMMAKKIDTTTDVLLHLNSSLVNAVNNASPSASYNTGTLNYTAAKFGNGITSTLSTANSNPTVLEFDLPYNAYGGKHDFTIEFWIKVSSGAANINGVGIGKSYTTISETNILRGCDVFLTIGYDMDTTFAPAIWTDGENVPYGFGNDINIVENVFNHVAISYNYATNKMYCFINGVLKKTITSILTHALTTTSKGIIVVSDSADIIDEVRISNVVRWTANFTPPTAPYTI